MATGLPLTVGELVFLLPQAKPTARPPRHRLWRTRVVPAAFAAKGNLRRHDDRPQ
jgi:hypothetical protein